MPFRLEIPASSLPEIDAALAQEKDAKTVRWLMGVRLVALRRSVPQAAQDLAVSDREVRRWVHRFLEGGVDGLRRRLARGAPTHWPASQEERFKERLRQGPRPEDRFSTWRGAFVQTLLAEEFGVHYSRSGVYALLHRLGFSSLMPRPRHPGSSPEAQERFKKRRSPKPSAESVAGTPDAGSNCGSRMRRASANKAR